MSFFSRGSKKQDAPKASSTGKKPDPASDAVKNHILELQRVIGNQATMRLLQDKSYQPDSARVPMSPVMLQDFPMLKTPCFMENFQLVHLQLDTYAQFLSAYQQYVDDTISREAYPLFEQYQGAFMNMGVLMARAMRENVKLFQMLLMQQLPKNSLKTDKVMQILDKLQAEVDKRVDGQDIKAIHGKVPENKKPSPEMLKLSTQGGAGSANDALALTMSSEAYVLAFFKRHNLDVDIYKQLIKLMVAPAPDEEKEEETSVAPAAPEHFAVHYVQKPS
jgi:hypothetical protein